MFSIHYVISRPRHVAITQGFGDVSQTRMEDEGLRLGKGIHHAMDEAHEEGGIEAHGT